MISTQSPWSLLFSLGVFLLVTGANQYCWADLVSTPIESTNTVYLNNGGEKTSYSGSLSGTDTIVYPGGSYQASASVAWNAAPGIVSAQGRAVWSDFIGFARVRITAVDQDELIYWRSSVSVKGSSPRASAYIEGVGGSSADSFNGVFSNNALGTFTLHAGQSKLISASANNFFFTDEAESASASIIYGVGGLPGKTPATAVVMNPISAEGASIYIPEGRENVELSSGADVATDTTGGYLTSPLPIGDDYGVTEPVFVKGQAAPAASATTPADATTNASDAAIAYAFVADNPFTSFVTPEGVPGDTSALALLFDGVTVSFDPDETFTFPEDVLSFTLLGLDTTVTPSIDDPAAFVHGFTFANAGTTPILELAFSAVPEPSPCILFVLAGIRFCSKRRAHKI